MNATDKAAWDTSLERCDKTILPGNVKVVEGFKQVSKHEFYKTVGSMDVVVSIPGAWDERSGYLKIWKKRNDETVGQSDSYNEGKRAACGDGVGRYWVRRSRA